MESLTIEFEERNYGMKRKAIIMILMSSVGLLVHGSGNNSLTDTLTIDKMETERLIALAPIMMLSQTNNVGDYMEHACKTIAKCPDTQMRYSYFRRLMESACMVDLANIENSVPQEKIEIPTENGPWNTLSREQARERAIRNRKYKIACIRGDGVGRLRRMAEKISDCLLMEQPEPAPGIELFEPYFKLIEKLRREERREGREQLSLCGQSVDQVERLFNFTHLKVLEVVRANPDPQDRAAVEARFKQVVGRPIRSAEQYKADARRRTEENIKEHQKQQEANRRALEFRKKYNREHNIHEQ